MAFSLGCVSFQRCVLYRDLRSSVVSFPLPSTCFQMSLQLVPWVSSPSWRSPLHPFCLWGNSRCSFSLRLHFLCFVLSLSFLLPESGASSSLWPAPFWAGKAGWWCYLWFWDSRNRTTLPIYQTCKPRGTSRTRTLRGTRGMSKGEGTSAAGGDERVGEGWHQLLWPVGVEGRSIRRVELQASQVLGTVTSPVPGSHFWCPHLL